MRPLIIDGDARAKVAAVLAYAKDHPYRPGPGVAPPGDDDRFVAQLNSYRAVFSFTEAQGERFRHLSISIPRRDDKFANPAAAFAIAELFGFSGWDGKTIDQAPSGWALAIHDDEHCIVLAQRLG